MTSRILWLLAAALYGLSIALFLMAGAEGAAPTDYRLWLLLALATLAAALGNAARAPGDGAD